ncbi:MAG: hypothetical protein ACD_20C00225G0025 [uncultured bacterium]|nr:MAG: hypothetical protein ACD_20C00225G0025 [uncultured bacterium]
MVTMVEKSAKKQVLARVKDEFENYLTEQCVKTTFNGIEVAEFSWYKKTLGIKS